MSFTFLLQVSTRYTVIMHPLWSWLYAWIKLALFLVLNASFTACRNITWRFTGLHSEIKNRQGEDGFVGAHKMKIRMKHILDILHPITLSNFLLTHEDFVDPEYVFSDNVTLLQVTKDTVIFIEAKKGMPPAFSMCFSFATVGQIATGEYIITMSLHTFFHLSEKLGKVDDKLVFLHNTSRCGGSLVTNILEHTGCVVGWNEPRVLDNVARQLNHTWNRKRSKRVLQATLRMLAKPYSDIDLSVAKYVIKTCVMIAPHWRMLHEAAPSATHMFVYRDLNAAAQSLARVNTTVPSTLIMHIMNHMGNPHGPALGYHWNGLEGLGLNNMACRYDYLLEFGYRLVRNAILGFHEMRKSGIHVSAIKYEDLVSHPESIVAGVLNEIGIPAQVLPRALKAMEVDSQAQVPFSQDKMAKLKVQTKLSGLDPEFLEDMQQEFEEVRVPGPYDWDENFRLAGTIIPK